MAQFFLTLPSNSSAKYFPDNTLTHFTTKLHTAVSLSGDWEVALTEVTFPKSWYTIEKGGGVIIVECGGYSSPELGTMHAYTSEIRVPAGYYENVTDIVREINKALSKIIPLYIVNPMIWKTENNGMPILKYHEGTKRVHFQMSRNQSITLSTTLMAILGVGNKQSPSVAKQEDSYTWVASRGSDISRGLNCLFIYSDIVEHVTVGDTRAPLLRIVDARGPHGETINHIYERPLYIPIQKKQFETVEILISDDFGVKIPFQSGKVIITLHFRQTKTPYFM